MPILSHQSPAPRPGRGADTPSVDWEGRVRSHQALLETLQEAAQRSEVPAAVRDAPPGDLFELPRFPVVAWMAMPGVAGLFDYDGTTAPKGKTPADTHLRPQTRELLRRATEAGVDVRVATGRAYEDVLDRFEGTGLKPENVIANHGINFAGQDLAPPQTLEKVQGWLAELCGRLAQAGFDLAGPSGAGIVLADKGTSFAISCRGLPEVAREQARVVIQGFVDELGAAVRTDYSSSRYGWDFRPEEVAAFDKGSTAQRMLERDGLLAMIPVGDGPNDESMMDWANALPGGASIREGPHPANALYSVEHQDAVDELLRGVVTVAEALQRG